MTEWIISVTGIALLTILCDVILPDGGTKKYVRTVIGVIISLSMLLPIGSFFGGLSVKDTATTQNITPQQDYIDYVDEQKVIAKRDNIFYVLDMYDVENYEIDLLTEEKTIVTVTCDEKTFTKLSQMLKNIDENIIVVWSNSNGKN